jgi:polyisoprenoid-binding protein YceI
MKLQRTILAAALALSGGAFASTWDIDTTHATAGFSVKHLSVTNTTGTLGNVTGTVELDEKDVTKSTINATIDVKTLSTNNEKRDAHLKSPDFFEVEKFPTATFKSTKLEKNGDKLKITGDLTMHGVTKSITLDAEMSPEVVNPFSKGTSRALSATGMLNREDWGLKWNAPMANNAFVVGKEVKLNLEAELSKKEAAKAMPPPAKAAPAAAPAPKK